LPALSWSSQGKPSRTAPLSSAARAHIAALERSPGVQEEEEEEEEELDLIFEPFFRSSRTRKNSNGYGLGLTIARRIIEAHNGQIRAGNRIDGGLCVDITLPCELLAGGTSSGFRNGTWS